MRHAAQRPAICPWPPESRPTAGHIIRLNKFAETPIERPPPRPSRSQTSTTPAGQPGIKRGRNATGITHTRAQDMAKKLRRRPGAPPLSLHNTNKSLKAAAKAALVAHHRAANRPVNDTGQTLVAHPALVAGRWGLSIRNQSEHPQRLEFGDRPHHRSTLRLNHARSAAHRQWTVFQALYLTHQLRPGRPARHINQQLPHLSGGACTFSCSTQRKRMRHLRSPRHRHLRINRGRAPHESPGPPRPALPGRRSPRSCRRGSRGPSAQ